MAYTSSAPRTPLPEEEELSKRQIAQPPQTFAQMQQQGFARPPAPNVAPKARPDLGFGGGGGGDFGPGGNTFNAPDPGRGTIGPGGFVPNQPGGARTIIGDQAHAGMTQGGGKPPSLTGPGGPYVHNTMPQDMQSFSGLPQDGAQSSSGFDPISQGMNQRYNEHQNPQPFNFSWGPMQEQLEAALSGGLQNPSRYDSSLVRDSFNSMDRQLGAQFDVDRQKINEDAARRGLYYSSDVSGRLGDVASNQANARRDIATNLLREQANTFGQDRSSAIGAAMGYGGQQFGNALQGYQANLNANQQGFSQQQQLLQNLLGYGQQSFNNQMTQNQFNLNQQGQQDQYDQELMQLLYGGAQ